MGVEEYESLADLMNARLEELGWSGAHAAREAEKRGIPLARSTINMVRAGRLNLSASRLGMVAQLLNVPRDKVFAAAGKGRLPEFSAELPRNVDLLTRAEREVVLSLIGHFLSGHARDEYSAEGETPPDHE